jgi:adenylate kinase family enzyme
MRRVLVVGCPGAGKTTFATKLAAMTDLPLVHLDVHYWRPGWQPPPTEQWRARVVELAGAASWVMDGNFFGTLSLRMPRAETLVWLDLPRAVCLRRVLMRAARDRGRDRPDLPSGCREQLSFGFLAEIWRFSDAEAPELRDAIASYGNHLQVHRLTGSDDIKGFFAHLERVG